MALKFDHAVILVHDLEQAAVDYRTLGFNVFYGGQHADGKTHNALIVFQDGSYLELLAPTDPALLNHIDPTDRSNFLFMFERGEGVGGFALQSDDLAADTAAMRERGLDVQMSPPGGRTRPDGTALHWQSAMLSGTMTPFFIQDLTPRNLRVPDDADKARHENGVKSVIALNVPTHDLEAGIGYYQAILGQPPYPLNPNNDPEPPTLARFDAGEKCGINVHSQPDADLMNGTFSIVLWSSQLTTVFEQLDSRLTHGVRIGVQLF